MSKPATQPTTSLEERKAQSNHDQREQAGDGMPKPLSGSKKVKKSKSLWAKSRRRQLNG